MHCNKVPMDTQSKEPNEKTANLRLFSQSLNVRTIES